MGFPWSHLGAWPPLVITLPFPRCLAILASTWRMRTVMKMSSKLLSTITSGPSSRPSCSSSGERGFVLSIFSCDGEACPQPSVLVGACPFLLFREGMFFSCTWGGGCREVPSAFCSPEVWDRNPRTLAGQLLKVLGLKPGRRFQALSP